MADLIPVEGNPFEQKAAPRGPTLVPVEGNPFEQSAGAAQRKGATIPVSGANIAHDLGTIWNDVSSIPGDMVEGGKALVNRIGHDVANPRDAVADAVRVLRKVNPLMAGYDSAKALLGVAEDPAKAVRGAATFAAERPVSAALNVALPASGGRVTAGRAALAAPTRTAAAVDAVAVRPLTELLSGVSSEAQQIASHAGEVGGFRGSVFRQNMAEPNYTAMQDNLRQGVRGAAHERSANYDTDMASVRANQTPISYRRILQSIDDMDREARGPGGNFPKDPAALAAVEDLRNLVRTHMADPTEIANPASMDALKQAIGVLRDTVPEGSRARRAVGGVYDAVGDTIRGAAPEYGAAMDRYRGASRDIDEVAKSLGAGERSTRFSTGGKLLSALRGGGAVANGARGGALADVTRHSPLLPYQIAGATMNPVMPRGIVGRGGALLSASGLLGGAGVSAAFLPQLLAALPALAAASPRLVGNTRYGVGSTVRGARRVGATQQNLGIALDVLRQAGLQDDEKKK